MYQLATAGPRSARARRLAMQLTPLAVALVLLCGVTLSGCSSPTPVSGPEAADSAVIPATAEGGASDQDDAAGADEPGTNADAEPTTAPEISLPTETPTRAPTTLITGRVTDSSGEPITDASVAIVESSVPVPEMAIFTDATGTYTWYVEPGTYTIEVYRDGYVSQEGETTVEEGNAAELDFQLEAR